MKSKEEKWIYGLLLDSYFLTCIYKQIWSKEFSILLSLIMNTVFIYYFFYQL